MARTDWRNYRRLLSYVGPYWYLLVGSIIGFLLAAGGQAYGASLLGQLIDEWDDAAAKASAMVPLLMLGAGAVRAVGTILGEVLIAEEDDAELRPRLADLFDVLGVEVGQVDVGDHRADEHGCDNDHCADHQY